MNEVSFLTNMKECETILKDWDLLQKASVNNIKNTSSSKYSNEFIRLSRDGDYYAMYKCAIENDDYDFLLKDRSFFQFTYDYSNEKNCEIIRMAFYPSTDEYTYESFLIKELGENINECGSEYYELFEQFLSEQTPSIKTFFRYDYDQSLYQNKIHSAAHIHFGDEENIRIPINSQLKPTAFIKMVLEYYYYQEWKEMIKQNDLFMWIVAHDTDVLSKEYFDEGDKKLPFLFVADCKK